MPRKAPTRRGRQPAKGEKPSSKTKKKLDKSFSKLSPLQKLAVSKTLSKKKKPPGKVKNVRRKDK